HFVHIVGMTASTHRIAAHRWNEPGGRLRVMDVRDVGGPKATFFPGAPDQVIGDVADHVVSAHSIPAPIRRTVPVKIERKLEVGNLPGKRLVADIDDVHVAEGTLAELVFTDN